MRYGVLSATILLAFCTVKGQRTNTLDSLLCKTLERHVEYLNIIGSTTPFLLLKDNIPLDFMADNNYAKGYNFVFFDVNSIKKRKLKKGIFAYRVLPIKLEVNTLLFNISKIFITYKKGLHFAVGDNYLYKYKYFCNKNDWVFIDMQHIGI